VHSMGNQRPGGEVDPSTSPAIIRLETPGCGGWDPLFTPVGESLRSLVAC
jgi:hypothetical protein